MLTAGRPATRPAPAATEYELAAAVIDALLRENYGGLARRVRADPAGLAGRALSLPGGPGKADIVVPLEPDGFLADLRVRRPAPPLTLAGVEAALEALADPADRDGVAAFTAECHQALAALRLREREAAAVRPAVPGQGAPVPGQGTAVPGQGPAVPGPEAAASRPELAGARLGAAGQLGYDALAAAMPHPVYPTSPGRLGFSDADSLRYAPEYQPEFELNWVAVPRDALTMSGPGQPPWWPEPPDVGLSASLASTHELLPVHPLTARRELAGALAETGLALAGALAEAGLAQAGLAAAERGGAGRAGAIVAPGRHLRVTPTLSTRTVALTGRPGIHLKLPLPISTLGLRNRRSIVPGTLADGALVRAIVATAAEQDQRLGSLLLADDSCYAHAGHPYLGYLMRRLPDGLDQCRVVPVAALLAPDTRAARDGCPLVVEALARWRSGSGLTGLMDLFRDYLAVLFDTHVQLFVRYGIALEAHQQNAALVLGPGRASGTAVRLLVKDFDGALINHMRLTAALGPDTPAASAFADDRLLTESDDALADVFITITVHLCAGALAFGLARRHVAPLPSLLALIREALTSALDRHQGSPPAALLRSRVLDADRLPGKSMVTAGTLAAKSRTGARDINKFYGMTGPNYLKVPGAPNRAAPRGGR